jgi:hypothetical protein
MNTVNDSAFCVNIERFDDLFINVGPRQFPEVLEIPGPADGPSEPTFDTVEWIEIQASNYRAMGSELAGLVAERIEDLARSWRALSHGRPITCEEFTAREEVMRELEYRGR